MGALDINWGDLASTLWAETVGDREIAAPDEEVTEASNPLVQWARENLPEWLQNGLVPIGNRLKNWAINTIQSIKSWGLTELWGLFNANRQFVWNFNFNASDEALEEQLRSQRVALAAQLGGAVGCSVGWAAGMAAGAALDAGVSAAGQALGMPLLVFDRAAMMHGLKVAGEEGLDELSAMFGNFARNLILFNLRFFAIKWYKNIRRLIKLSNRYGLAALLPDGVNQAIENWGAKNAEPWSFAIATENAIESIPNEGIRAFAENFIEEADECFIEAGYIYAASVDGYKQNLMDTREAVLGVQQTVEIVPDRDAPDEVIVVSGRDQVARGAIMSSLATHQMVQNRDMGQIVGRDINEAMLNQTPHSTLSLRLRWSPRKEPPFTKTQHALDGFNPNLWTAPEFNLPWLDPVKMDWDRIKRAAGGLEGFESGPIRVSAYIGWPELGLAGRAVTIFAGTRSEGRRILESLADLSSGELHSIRYGERQNDPNNPNLTQKERVRVYPQYCYVTSQRREIDKSKGRGTLTGNWSPRRERVELWTAEEGVGVAAILTDLKRWHTPLPFAP